MFIPCSATIGGTTISTLSQSTFNAGMERVMLGAAGNHQAEFVALMRQLANGTIGTRKIDALATVTEGAHAIIFRQVTQGGTGNTTYKSITGGATALAIPRRVTWSPGQPATLDIELMFLSTNGTTAPVTVGSTAGSLTAEADVWVGAGQGVTQITVDFGFQINVPPDGLLYPVNAFIARQLPEISITYLDETYLATAAANPGSISTLTAQFSKIASGGVRGATRSYALTGQVYVDSATGSVPGTVVMKCAGTGGLTIT